MTQEYKPEFGQIFFGQPHKQYSVSNIWEAALSCLRDRLDIAMWNIHQKEYNSPFNNTGAEFTSLKEFQVYAYSWNEETEQPYNFKWGEIEIGWYKHSERGLSANRPLSPDDASRMLDECLAAVERYECEKMRERGVWWP